MSIKRLSFVIWCSIKIDGSPFELPSKVSDESGSTYLSFSSAVIVACAAANLASGTR